MDEERLNVDNEKMDVVGNVMLGNRGVRYDRM